MSNVMTQFHRYDENLYYLVSKHLQHFLGAVMMGVSKTCFKRLLTHSQTCIQDGSHKLGPFELLQRFEKRGKSLRPFTSALV
jgi:hypothetical protein